MYLFCTLVYMDMNSLCTTVYLDMYFLYTTVYLDMYLLCTAVYLDMHLLCTAVYLDMYLLCTAGRNVGGNGFKLYAHFSGGSRLILFLLEFWKKSINKAQVTHRTFTGVLQWGEEGQPQQLLVRATFSSFSRPSHL